MEILARFRHPSVRKCVTMPVGETATHDGRTLHVVPAGIPVRANG